MYTQKYTTVYINKHMRAGQRSENKDSIFGTYLLNKSFFFGNCQHNKCNKYVYEYSGLRGRKSGTLDPKFKIALIMIKFGMWADFWCRIYCFMDRAVE